MYNPNNTLNSTKSRSSAFRIGKEARKKIDKEELQKPGSGAYNPTSDFKGNQSPKFGFGTSKRHSLKNSNDKVGPGAYEITRKIGDGPSYPMSPKINLVKKNSFKDVGPGSYDPNLDSIKAKIMKVGFEKSLRPSN